MQYMNQGSLLQLLQEKFDKFSKKDLETMILHTVRGMAYLEEKNILHLDLAARNLLVSDQITDENESFSVKVSDFGLGIVVPKTDDQYFPAKNEKVPVIL
jgi:serine/threonine protein kinase